MLLRPLFVIAGTLLASFVFAQGYTATDLNLGAGGSSLIKISDSGIIAGLEGPSYSLSCFRIVNGVREDLPRYNDQDTMLYGLNNAGTLVGYSGSSAWWYDTGAHGSPGPNGTGAWFTSINDSGQCVGMYVRSVNGQNTATPCSYANGTWTGLALPNNYVYGRAGSINSSGV